METSNLISHMGVAPNQDYKKSIVVKNYNIVQKTTQKADG